MRHRASAASPAPGRPPTAVTNRRRLSALRCWSLAAMLLIGSSCSACVAPVATQRELAAYRIMRGTLMRAETTFVGTRGRYTTYGVRLESSTGLVATGRLLAPTHPARHPAVLLNDGRELNSNAVDYLPSEFGDVVVLSLDYPEELPYELDAGTFLLRGAALHDAAERIPALFSLGAEYLATRADVDDARIAIAATSFAVPFATIAAAVDPRFRNVALIYGAGDLARVLAANLDLRPAPLRTVVANIMLMPFGDLEPTRYIAAISPRPVIMVNGSDDPQVPRSAVWKLYTAAREPKSLVWLETGHLMPTDTTLIRALVDTALARLPILQQPPQLRPAHMPTVPSPAIVSAATHR